MLICSFCGDIWPWTQSTTKKSMMLKLHFDLHICRLSTGVECVCWTNRLSGRQTKLLSCPVVSARDLKKLKLVILNGHETEIPFLLHRVCAARDPSCDAMQSLPKKVSDRGGRSCRDNPRCPDGNIAPIETGMDMDSGWYPFINAF